MAQFGASFRVMRSDLDPSEVSGLLGLTPDHCHQRGDPRISKTGKRFSDFSEGLWELKSGLSLSDSLTRELVALTDILKDRQSSIEQLRKLGYVMDVFVGVFDEGGNTLFTMEAEVMRTLSLLGLEVVFDVYP